MIKQIGMTAIGVIVGMIAFGFIKKAFPALGNFSTDDYEETLD
jgi:hypothetical protein